MLLSPFLPWSTQFTYPKPQWESKLESGLKYMIFLHTDCKPWLIPCTRGAAFQTFSHSTLQPTACADSPCWSLAGLSRDSLTPPAPLALLLPWELTLLPPRGSQAPVAPKVPQMKLGSLNIRVGLNYQKMHHKLSCNKGLNHPTINKLFACNEKFKINFLLLL